MKYLYITYGGNKRTTTLSDGTNLVRKYDTVQSVAHVIAPIVTPVVEQPTLMCNKQIHDNYLIEHAKYVEGRA